MNLGEFKTLVKDEVNRGSSLDVAIATKIRQAARWLERNHSFQYMDRWVSFIIDASAATPRLLNPPPFARSYEFFRLINDDGSYTYLNLVKASDVTVTLTDAPEGFWLDGDENIVLDNTPEEDYSAEISYSRFTDWAALSDASEHWLFNNAEDVLLSQTMLAMAAYMRAPPGFGSRYRKMRNEGIRTLITADEARLYSPAAQSQMNFEGG